jgi:hypothetical protein
MTDDEKNVAKGMGRLIARLTLTKAAHESLLKVAVGEGWQEQVTRVLASEPLQTFERQLAQILQVSDRLIDEGQLGSSWDKVSTFHSN